MPWCEELPDGQKYVGAKSATAVLVRNREIPGQATDGHLEEAAALLAVCL